MIAVAGVVVLLAGVLLFMRYRKTGVTNQTNTNTPVNTNQAANTNAVVSNTNNANTNSTNTNAVITNTTPTTTEFSEASLKSIARSFAERFGTYSNQNNFENIEHLIPYMTERMKQWATNYLEEKRANPVYAGIYHGITTRSLSIETVSYDTSTGTAEFMIKTQRRESTGSTSNSQLTYQDIQIKFRRDQGIWKVDEAWWK
jgi:hypothetical protein